MSAEIKRVRIGAVIWTAEGSAVCSSINAAKRVSTQGEQGVRAFGGRSHGGSHAEGLRFIRSLGWT